MMSLLCNSTLVDLEGYQFLQIFYKSGNHFFGGDDLHIEVNETPFLIVFQKSLRYVMLQISMSALNINEYKTTSIEVNASFKDKYDFESASVFSNGLTIKSRSAENGLLTVMRCIEVVKVVNDERIVPAFVISFESGETLLIKDNDSPSGLNLKFGCQDWMATLLGG